MADRELVQKLEGVTVSGESGLEENQKKAISASLKPVKWQ
jgi:hypothetical protein